MCPSRLPNEVTSYRPSGMLDRDQRTAFTIIRIRDGSTASVPTAAAKKNSRPNSRHQCNNTSERVDAQTKDLSGGCKCKCDCQQNDGGSLWEDSSAANIRLARKYTATSGYYRSRTKFVNYLLAIICIWLATIHRTCAYPISQSAMSGDAQRCKAIKDALNKPIEQSSIASQYIRGLLDNYTQAQFKMQPIEVHDEWKKHSAHFNYGMGIEKYLPEDFDGEPEESHLDHVLGEGVPSENELSMEFQKIYVYLQTLKKVFHDILDDRKTNATQIMHHLNNNRKTHDAINHLFEEQFRYSNLDITEVETAMTALQIPYPELEEVMIGNKDRIIGEWLATREYLKVLRYMRGVYNIFLQRCS